ncbi:spermidine synthase [Yinghuangia sp. ASG 101]|uniref:spermidine synthase n=1 Tax=Yinghuangia sp. ASG 101 TaxID=2896848 RepID=UPI001E2C40F8|nr:spermidine synthase [Yinghuangia sp. ASG 101]UGQ13312.1 spermidine synthase [Yinghuangia sp. ASG 101]
MPVKREDDIATTVVDRVTTENGELVLRCVGSHFEIISNGTFLMDTRDGQSERLLVDAAVDAAADAAGAAGLRVLIGGLGVGFSLGAAVARPEVGHIVVVERELPVITWQSGPLAPFSDHAPHDPRVEIRHTDLVAWVHAAADDAAGEVPSGAERFDVLCLDIDNGPDWTVTSSNDSLYGDAGLRALRRRLRPGGVLAVWSAAASPAFAARLAAVFDDVRAEEVPVRVPRGVPDVVYLAR